MFKNQEKIFYSINGIDVSTPFFYRLVLDLNSNFEDNTINYINLYTHKGTYTLYIPYNVTEDIANQKCHIRDISTNILLEYRTNLIEATRYQIYNKYDYNSNDGWSETSDNNKLSIRETIQINDTPYNLTNGKKNIDISNSTHIKITTDGKQNIKYKFLGEIYYKTLDNESIINIQQLREISPERYITLYIKNTTIINEITNVITLDTFIFK